MNKQSLESERRAPPLCQLGQLSLLHAGTGEVPAGAPQWRAGGFGTLLLCWCWRGGLHSLLSTAGSSQTSLTPALVCSLSAHFRTQKHGPRCRLGFCRPDASITPSAWRTDAAAQSSFLQIQMLFLFIFSNSLCLNISTACTVYLKFSVLF